MSIPMDPLAALREYFLTVADITELTERYIYNGGMPADVLSEMPRSVLVLQGANSVPQGNTYILTSDVIARCYGSDAYQARQLALAIMGACQDCYRKFLGRTLLHDVACTGSTIGLVEQDTNFNVCLVNLTIMTDFRAWQ